MTFWWRRCSEQSRSLRWMVRPCASASTWISTWRGASTYFSISTPRVAERRLRLALRGRKRVLEFRMLVDPPHAAAAAARHRLDQDRIADLIGLALEEGGRLLFAVIAGDDGHAGLLHQRLGAILEAHGADRSRRRTDKDDAGRGAGLGKIGILRDEAVARMHALCAAAACRLDQPVDREIAFARRRRPDRHRLVAHAHMEGAGIGVGIDRDRPHAEPLRGARDADRDLAPIGDQDRREHLQGHPGAEG